MGKGAWRRPAMVSREQYEKNWARIFAKPQPSAPMLEVLPDGTEVNENE